MCNEIRPHVNKLTFGYTNSIPRQQASVSGGMCYADCSHAVSKTNLLRLSVVDSWPITITERQPHTSVCPPPTHMLVRIISKSIQGSGYTPISTSCTTPNTDQCGASIDCLAVDLQTMAMENGVSIQSVGDRELC